MSDPKPPARAPGMLVLSRSLSVARGLLLLGVVSACSSRGAPAGHFFRRDQRPYTADSPWNTPIPADAEVDPASREMVATILSNNDGTLRSDPNQYTFPIYYADSSTPRRQLSCSGVASTTHEDGRRTEAPGGRMPGVPVPPEAIPSTGTDGQIIVIDVETGDEWDIWQLVLPDRCTNLTRYVRGVYRDAVETDYMSRGAGVPYLAGIFRPHEIERGRIDHALAFSYRTPRRGRCVWPASKTDGRSDLPNVLPEGARLQLDPALDVSRIPGLSDTGRIVARALQEYGAFVIDVGGANKIYPEDNLTARWGERLVATTVSAIPVEQLRVLRLPDGYNAEPYTPNHGRCVR